MPIVELEKASLMRAPTERGYSLAGSSARIGLAAQSFEALLDRLTLRLRTLYTYLRVERGDETLGRIAEAGGCAYNVLEVPAADQEPPRPCGGG